MEDKEVVMEVRRLAQQKHEMLGSLENARNILKYPSEETYEWLHAALTMAIDQGIAYAQNR